VSLVALEAKLFLAFECEGPWWDGAGVLISHVNTCEAGIPMFDGMIVSKKGS
jgi:hypothetical protein